MSKIGKEHINLDGAKVTRDGQSITVVGPLGSLNRKVLDGIDFLIDDEKIQVFKKEGFSNNAFWGLERSLISNMVIGVNKGFMTSLEIIGVGYRARVEGETLVLILGYSHPIKMKIPQGLKVVVTDENKVAVSGIDKQLVGQFAALIRKQRPPEPYKGKGVRITGEYVRKKAGKSGKATV